MADEPPVAEGAPQEQEPTAPEPRAADSSDDASAGQGRFTQADIDAALSQADASADTEDAETAAVDDSSPADSEESPGTSAPRAQATEDDVSAEALTEMAEAETGEHVGEASAKPESDARVDASGNVFDAAAAEMAAAIAEEAAASPGATLPDQTATSPELPDFSGDEGSGEGHGISLLNDVNLRVHIELGRTWMYVEDVLKLNEGSVVELESLAGDPVDIFVNERLIARGEVLVLNDNFCVRVSEIVSDLEGAAVA